MYVKCNDYHDVFDIGFLENILAIHPHALRVQLRKPTLYVEALKCYKLVYFEFGFSLEYAKRRVRFLKSLSASKRRTLIERHNASWVDLLREWGAKTQGN